MRIGIVFPVQPNNTTDVKAFGRWVMERPGTRLWTAQSTLIDSHQAMAFAAGAGIRCPIGFGVALTPMAHPVLAAAQARSLALLTGHDVWAGFGTGGLHVEAGMLGQKYASPTTAVREYLEVCRLALDAESFEYNGEVFDVSGGAPNFRTPDVRLGAGVLRPRMASVIKDAADFVVTWLSPLNHISGILMPALTRADQTRPKIVAMVHSRLTTPGVDKQELIDDMTTPHLGAAHYRAMLRSSGIGADPQDTPAQVAEQLVDANVLLHGDVDDIVEGLVAYEAAGVQEVALNISGSFRRFGAQRALAEMSAIYAGYTAARPSREFEHSMAPPV
jgi:alkanesulfonate monooxygenase SsuD/methylene tetrahydromethanopterin reductase-like flavin-dependent oxidoreductase (luciferase family)